MTPAVFNNLLLGQLAARFVMLLSSWEIHPLAMINNTSSFIIIWYHFPAHVTHIKHDSLTR